MSLSASEMRTCTQLGRMLVTPDSRVLVVTTSVARVKEMMAAMKKFVGPLDDSVTLDNTNMVIRRSDGGRIDFKVVYTLDAFLYGMVGTTFTNMLYDFMLGAQIPSLCRALKPNLRSAYYRGPFTIEPLED